MQETEFSEPSNNNDDNSYRLLWGVNSDIKL